MDTVHRSVAARAGHGRELPSAVNAIVRTAGTVTDSDVSPDDLVVLTPLTSELQVSFVPASDEGLSEGVRATFGKGPDGQQEMWWVDVGAQANLVSHRFEYGGTGLGDAVDAIVGGRAPW